jgi:hypothetical protein
MDCVSTLLASLVSATTFVASAVAVTVAPPLVAVHVPLIATVAVAPAAIAGALPLSVVPPTVTRVTLAAAPLVPRLWTATLKPTAAPTAGLAGLVLIPVTCRSGPGAGPTTSCVGAVKVLLASFCSGTRWSGSTVAATG